MKWRLFENKIKEDVSGHRSEVDVDALWAAIEPEVDAINRNRRKRRFGWLWFAVAGLLIAGAGLGYYFLSPQDVPATGMGDLPVAIPANAPEDQKQRNTETEGTVPAEEIVQEETTVLQERAHQSHSAITIQKQTNNNIPAGMMADEPEATRTAIAGNFNNRGEAPPVGILKSDEPALVEKQSGQLLPAEEEKAEKANSITQKPATGQPSTTILREDIPMELPSYLSLLPIGPLEAENSGALTTFSESPDSPEPAEHPVVPPVRRNPFRFSAGVHTNISFIDRQLSASDSVSMELRSIRENSERLLESVQGGIRLRLGHESGFELTTGLNYTQINERFDYNTSVTEVDSVFGIQALRINLENDTVAFYGQVPLERTTEFRKRFYNNYRMLDIPVILGYRFQTGDFRVGAQAGVFVNVNLSTKGRILESATTDVDIDEAGIFKSSVGMSYYFGLTAGYMLNDNLEVYVSPSMRYFPSSFTESAYGLKQEYRLYGLDVGVMWVFK